MAFKETLIKRISEYWYYEDGVLEQKSEDELVEIWNDVIDWVEGTH